MVRKGDLDLHLFTRSDAAVEGFCIAQDALNQRVVFSVDRKGELPTDEEM